MSDKKAPAEVFSLAEHLAGEMKARGWTTSDVARHMRPGSDYIREKLAFDLLMGISPTRETLLINDDAYTDLAYAFGVSPQFLRNIHATWQKWPNSRAAFECPEELFGTDIQLSIPEGLP